MSRILLLILLSCFTFMFVSASHAKRLALVIGNDSYANIRSLERARNDAKAIGRTLVKLGFKVIDGYDLSRRDMNRRLSRLANQIEPGDEVIFFYAGHGVSVEGQNYLVPVDVPKLRSGEQGLLKDESIQVSRVTSIIKRKGARITLLILDACRNNPFQDESSGRSIGNSRGLSSISSPGSGSMVIFSAGANQEALDRLTSVPDTSKNSVFTRALIPLMEQRGLEIKSLAIQLRKKVNILAKQDSHEQTPASYDEIINDYYLAGRSIKVEGTNKSSSATVTAPPNCSAQDKALWARVQQEKTKSAYEFYRSRFPKGCNVAVAEFEIAALQKLNKPQTNKPVKPVVGVYPNAFTHGYKFQDCRDCPKMIVVRGDTFTMGSSKSEKDSQDDERPQHKVTIKKFAVGQYEITREQFHKFVQETGYNAGNKCVTYEGSKLKLRANRNYLNPGFSQTSDHPVTCVNWDDAKAYVKWLSRKTGKTYRLLTEAEWEYVSSAKRSTAFWWGNSISTDQANYNGKGTYNGSKGVYRKKTVAVDSFEANPFGLKNVHGNVWEWVEDCWHNSYKNAPTDSSAWLETNGGDCKHRVLRGGSWLYDPRSIRARIRNRSGLDDRDNDVGFRVARMP